MQKPSILFWIISVLALLWGAFGVFDFYMTKTGNEEYLQDFAPEMIGWIGDFPMWRVVLWATGVGAALIGPILMLTRNGLAPTIMWVGVLAFLVGFVGHDILMADGINYYGQAGMIASVGIGVISAFFAWYSSHAKSKGYLS